MLHKLCETELLIESKNSIRNKLLGSQELLALISDDPDIDIESDDVEEWEQHIADHISIDYTVEASGLWIMIESRLDKGIGASFNLFEVNVYIVCSDQYTRIDKSKFRGITGNRRDNAVRVIDNIVNHSDDFGIGKLEVADISPLEVPDGFNAMQMTYTIRDFKVR